MLSGARVSKLQIAQLETFTRPRARKRSLITSNEGIKDSQTVCMQARVKVPRPSGAAPDGESSRTRSTSAETLDVCHLFVVAFDTQPIPCRSIARLAGTVRRVGVTLAVDRHASPATPFLSRTHAAQSFTCEAARSPMRMSQCLCAIYLKFYSCKRSIDCSASGCPGASGSDAAPMISDQLAPTPSHAL